MKAEYNAVTDDLNMSIISDRFLRHKLIYLVSIVDTDGLVL